jgi:isoquinoline 1-oxidoreductase subunit beta
VIYGLSAALYGEITIKRGPVEQTNFDEYQVVRLAAPRIEVYLALSARSGAATAPAVANALFAATGTRVRSLPLKNVKLPGPV